jgi:hypothetical protein
VAGRFWQPIGNQRTKSLWDGSADKPRVRRHRLLQGLSARIATPLEPWTFCVSVSTSIEEPENQKIVDLQALQAADGTRTHDLLHGKQTL